MNLLQYDASLKDWCHHKSMIIKSYNLSIFSLDNNLSIFHLLQYDHNPEMILPISGLSWDRQGLAHRAEKNARAKKKIVCQGVAQNSTTGSNNMGCVVLINMYQYVDT